MDKKKLSHGKRRYQDDFLEDFEKEVQKYKFFTKKSVPRPAGSVEDDPFAYPKGLNPYRSTKKFIEDTIPYAGEFERFVRYELPDIIFSDEENSTVLDHKQAQKSFATTNKVIKDLNKGKQNMFIEENKSMISREEPLSSKEVIHEEPLPPKEVIHEEPLSSKEVVHEEPLPSKEVMREEPLSEEVIREEPFKSLRVLLVRIDEIADGFLEMKTGSRSASKINVLPKNSAKSNFSKLKLGCKKRKIDKKSMAKKNTTRGVKQKNLI